MLLETVEKEPQELEYEFGRWSAQRLATYLEEETGISLKRRIYQKNRSRNAQYTFKVFAPNTVQIII